jgi:hypothetical protein
MSRSGVLLEVLMMCTAVGAAAEWKVTGSSSMSKKYMKPLIYEGLSNNGEHFIMNSKNNIFLINSTDYSPIMSTLNAIPADLRDQGYDHLGDCQFYDGLLYFAVEEPSFTRPSIFVYDVNDDEFVFKKHMPQPMQSHMPWVAINTDIGNSGLPVYAYSSEFDNTTQIFAYDVDTLEFSHTVPLSTTLNSVQGGAFYDGLLYVGVNTADTVYSINVSTGRVEVALEQHPEEGKHGRSSAYEFEGLTFLDLTHRGQGRMHNTGNYWSHPREMGTVVHSDLL